jgi:hypothetical protein
VVDGLDDDEILVDGMWSPCKLLGIHSIWITRIHKVVFIYKKVSYHYGCMKGRIFLQLYLLFYLLEVHEIKEN